MSAHERQIRQNVRNLLCFATREELSKELEISIDRKDVIRARFVQELIDEQE